LILDPPRRQNVATRRSASIRLKKCDFKSDR
jgi:hypothetical protein